MKNMYKISDPVHSLMITCYDVTIESLYMRSNYNKFVLFHKNIIASEVSPSAAAQPPRLGAAEGALSDIRF